MIMPLLWISLAFIGGIIVSSLLSFPINYWLWSAAIIAIGASLANKIIARRNIVLPNFPYAWMLVFALAFIAGGARYQFAQPNFDDPFQVAFYNDRDYEILVTGTLVEPPDYRETYTNLKIKAEAIDSGSGDLSASGLVLVRAAPHQTYEYGERIRARGKLKTPPENEEFSYRDYLARGGVYSYMTIAEITVLPGNGGYSPFTQIYKLKDALLKNIYRIYHDPEASLFAGILLGVDTGLTSKLQTAFKNTGTSHIIAISGFNMAIIAGIFFATFKIFFGERYGAVFAVLGIAFYTLLVGADPAVVRAALMGSISLFARQIGRRNAGINALAVVALAMTIYNPLTLWDVGFQLSFLATLGLILYAEPFSNFTSNLLAKISKHDLSAFSRIINDNVILTFAAQLTTIPIMAYHFQRISLISFIANPFILFVQPAVMILGGLAAFVSLIIFPLGQLLAWFAWPFAAYTIRIVELFNVRGGVIVLKDSSGWMVLAFYAALLGVTLSWSAISEYFNARKDSIRAAIVTATLALLFICTMILWRSADSAGDGKLHVTFLDAGSASGVLIQTPEGRNVLINGGESVNKLSDELGRRLPFFSRKLDWLIVAAADENEIAALPRVVERYPPDNVLWSGNIQSSFSAQTLDKYFADNSVPVTLAEMGQRLDLGGGDSYVEVKSVSGKGSVILVQYKNFRALLPIGVSAETWEALEYGKVIEKVDVLLLANSGYAPSNPPEIIANLNPQLTILSVAAGDKDGNPSQDVLKSLEGFSLLRTDHSGWISVITDGNEMRVEAERNNNNESIIKP